jgi:hypothetical protein
MDGQFVAETFFMYIIIVISSEEMKAGGSLCK